VVVGRGELSDSAWAQIAPLLPAVGGRGGQWLDHRQVINAILWKLRTGAARRDLPERYGPWKTAHERLRKWTADRSGERILDQVIVKDDAVGNVEWTVSIDSSSVRAHQHSAGARKKGLHDRVGQRTHRRRRAPRTVPRRTDQQDLPEPEHVRPPAQVQRLVLLQAAELPAGLDHAALMR
jgi:transposase